MKRDKLCKSANCERLVAVKAQGLCSACYQRKWKDGTLKRVRDHNELSLLDRLIKRIGLCRDTGCWLWTAGKTNGGYGTIKHQGKLWRAHVAAFCIFVKPVPPHKEVCHKCDNPSCINPKHLFLGTHRENMLDAKVKGRMARGERARSTKITETTAKNIKIDITDGSLTQVEIAEKHSVNPSIVRMIKSGRAWAWLDV